MCYFVEGYYAESLPWVKETLGSFLCVCVAPLNVFAKAPVPQSKTLQSYVLFFTIYGYWSGFLLPFHPLYIPILQVIIQKPSRLHRTTVQWPLTQSYQQDVKVVLTLKLFF